MQKCTNKTGFIEVCCYGDTHMTDLPHENRRMNPNGGATRPQCDLEESADENGHPNSRAFEDWLTQYRNRLARVLSDGTQDRADD